MLSKLFDAVFGSKNEKDLKLLLPLVHQINQAEPWAMALTADQFPQETQAMRQAIAGGAAVDDHLPKAFALAREAARRTLGERLYDVQILGGIVLHQGKIMEMKTGEGKTVSSVPAAYLNSLTGRGVHVITVNDYLAERDADWMRPVYSYLGVRVGTILSQMDTEVRRKAYRCDITYGTNNEFGFDYLRDNMRFDSAERLQKDHHYCIIDEIDSILVDEARTPLIISGQAQDDTKKYVVIDRAVRDLQECEKDPATGDYPDEPVGDFKADEKSKRVSFTETGLNNLEQVLVRRNIIRGTLYDDENFEFIHYATQAIRAQKLYQLDRDYVVKDGQVQIVDEFTGRILHGRRYSEGLHQAIEAKEGIRVAQRNRTLATITFQNFFRMYQKLSGMTGTAETEAKEFGKIYGLDVVVIPTNRPVARDDEDDVIFLDEADKYQAIGDEIEAVHRAGQPVLVGTASIGRSELLSQLLTKRGIRHEVLNAKNHAREALIIAEAGAKGAVTIATNMAGRGTDIKLGGNLEYRARRRAGSDADDAALHSAIAAEHARWKADYEEVKALGGLYVLGTERHESRRIDNQLRGRSGRQGDPGRSRFFISMDDDLLRLFGGGKGSMKKLMARVGLKPGEPLNHPWINRAIEKAQKRVEERNFDIRKHLLEFDDVLNEQRKFIYEQRDAILRDDDLVGRVLRTAADVVEELVEPYTKTRGNDKTLFSEFVVAVREQLYFAIDSQDTGLADFPADRLSGAVVELMRTEVLQKAAHIGTERLNIALRFEYLRSIDARWQDHLENLESLREAVYLRSYAQKNPLLEYKIEGFQIFDALLAEIRVAIARKLFLVRVEANTGSGPRFPAAATPAVATAHHSQVEVFAGAGAATAGSGRSTGNANAGGRPTIVTRTYPKVGRNDPCPCGSGKKYKHCHGA